MTSTVPFHLMRMKAGNVIALRTEWPRFAVIRYDADEAEQVAWRILRHSGFLDNEKPLLAA